MLHITVAFTKPCAFVLSNCNHLITYSVGFTNLYPVQFYIYEFFLKVSVSGPGSSVGILTDYGLDGPGSNPGGDEIFRPSRPYGRKGRRGSRGIAVLYRH